ncbi:hypothetical protein XENORESO_020680, partial [Xenotaenia resolanae]
VKTASRPVQQRYPSPYHDTTSYHHRAWLQGLVADSKLDAPFPPNIWRTDPSDPCSFPPGDGPLHQASSLLSKGCEGNSGLQSWTKVAQRSRRFCQLLVNDGSSFQKHHS